MPQRRAMKTRGGSGTLKRRQSADRESAIVRQELTTPVDLAGPRAASKSAPGDVGTANGDPPRALEEEWQKLARERQRNLEEAGKLREDARQAELPARLKQCNISPDDAPFQLVLKRFQAEISGPEAKQSIAEVLNDGFTQHEIDLLVPASERDNPALHKIQQDNRERYHVMMDTPRFEAWKPKAMLAFKFTMVYFGLPTEPLKYELRRERSSWPPTGPDYDDDDFLRTINPSMPTESLRFLNSYTKRAYKSDYRKADPDLERQYEGRKEDTRAMPDFLGGLRLRGGGDDFDEDDIDARSEVSLSSLGDTEADYDDMEDEAEYFSKHGRGSSENDDGKEDDHYSGAVLDLNRIGGEQQACLSLRGGGGRARKATASGQEKKDHGNQAPSTTMTIAKPVNNIGGDPVLSYLYNTGEGRKGDHQWIPLHGTQGVVHFDIYKLETFVDAIDRLLCLDGREGAHVNIFFSDGRETQRVSLHAPPTNWPSEKAALGQIRQAIVTDVTKQLTIHLTVGLEKPLAAVPGPAARILTTRLDLAHRPHDTAYLRMPQNPNHIVGENDYAPWFRHLVRVLWPGSIPGHPGESHIPHAAFGYGDFQFLSYGGLSLPRTAWEDFRSDYMEGSQVESIIGEQWTVPIHRFGLFIPGFCVASLDKRDPGDDRLQWIPHAIATPENWLQVWGLIREAIFASLYPDEEALIESIDIWFPGERMFRPGDEPATLPVLATAQADPAADSEHLLYWSSIMGLIENRLRKPGRLGTSPQFFAARPRFRHYTMEYTQAGGNVLHNQIANLDELCIGGFRNAVSVLLGQDAGVQHDLARSIIVLEQRKQNSKLTAGDPRHANKLAFTISQQTKMSEWQVIRNKITTSTWRISLARPEDSKPTFSEAQVWGFNDFYDRKTSGLFNWVKFRDYDRLTALEQAFKPPEEEAEVGEAIEPQTVPSSSSSALDRGKLNRERSYYEALSAFETGVLPINGPPVEAVLNTGASSMPRLTLGVLTPTEQKRLNHKVFEYRQLTLQRVKSCQYDGCDAVFSIGEDEEARLQAHLQSEHAGVRCNFCDQVLYHSWSAERRKQHFLQNHTEYFLTDPDPKLTAGVTLPLAVSLDLVDYAREARYRFCPRCGRDHEALDVEDDRIRHDNICFPTTAARPAVRYCPGCGDEAQSGHACADMAQRDAGDLPQCCSQCGESMRRYTDRYRQIHKTGCKGFGWQVIYCPWCGDNTGGTPASKLAHIKSCRSLPPGNDIGQPICMNLGTDIIPESQLNADGGRQPSDPIGTCPGHGCGENLSGRDGAGLLRHIEQRHDPGLRHCIFCSLDLDKRQWDRASKVTHMEDHIAENAQKIAAELVLGSGLAPQDPEFIQALSDAGYIPARHAPARPSRKSLSSNTNRNLALVPAETPNFDQFWELAAVESPLPALPDSVFPDLDPPALTVARAGIAHHVISESGTSASSSEDSAEENDGVRYTGDAYVQAALPKSPTKRKRHAVDTAQDDASYVPENEEEDGDNTTARSNKSKRARRMSPTKSTALPSSYAPYTLATAAPHKAMVVEKGSLVSSSSLLQPPWMGARETRSRSRSPSKEGSQVAASGSPSKSDKGKGAAGKRSK